MELYARDSKGIRYKCESPSCETGFNLISDGNHTMLSAAVQTSRHPTGQQCCTSLLNHICISSICSLSVYKVRKLQKA